MNHLPSQDTHTIAHQLITRLASFERKINSIVTRMHAISLAEFQQNELLQKFVFVRLHRAMFDILEVIGMQAQLQHNAILHTRDECFAFLHSLPTMSQEMIDKFQQLCLFFDTYQDIHTESNILELYTLVIDYIPTIQMYSTLFWQSITENSSYTSS